MTKLSEINFSAPDVSRTNSTVLNRSLMHTAAKLHYIEGLSQVEVSRKLQISTASVSRLLARAREEAIVRIHVADLDEIDEIGDRLQGALGLVEVRVVDTAESGAVAALSSQIADFESEWRITQLEEKRRAMLERAIQPFELEIDRLEGKAKLSQNKPLEERLRIAHALNERGEHAVAYHMIEDEAEEDD